MRGVLGGSIFRIRFLSLTEEVFKKHVVASGVLTDTEVIAIIETMKSGTGNHKYHWALPARNRRTWLCEYNFVEQLKNTIFFGGLITVCAVVLYPHLLVQFVALIKSGIEKLQEIWRREQELRRQYRE